MELFEEIRQGHAAGETIQGLATKHGIHRRMVRQATSAAIPPSRYRAVDSTGATIDFLLSARRDAAAAKRFFQKALETPGHPRPRVINVDGNPAYPKVISELPAATFSPIFVPGQKR